MPSLREMIRQRRNRKDLYSTAAYWDYKAKTHKGKAASMWPNEALDHLYEREQENLLSQYLGELSGLKVLDIGCGTGRLSRWFAAQGAHVTGVDFSAEAIVVAKRESDGDNPTFRRESVFELADDNRYDVAFLWGCLTVACRDRNELRDALSRIRRALRAEGRLLLTEPIHSGFLHRVLDLDLAGFLAVMREAGFEVKGTAPLHFWPMRLVLAYVPWPTWITAPLYHLGQVAMRVPGFSALGDYRAILAYPARAVHPTAVDTKRA